MKLNQLKLNSKTLTAFSLPVLLAVAGCDGTSLSDVESDLANGGTVGIDLSTNCLLYTSPSPRDQRGSRMPSSA